MAATLLDRLLPGRRRWRGRLFDRRRGIETSKPLEREELLGMPAELRAHAGQYLPTDLPLFRRIVRRSGVDPAQFSFVDLGCGKGRILIAAADYAFRTIIGVEADANLVAVARTNVEQSGAGESRISVLHCDAREADLPDGNLFVFMYSPFRGPVFEAVARRLAALAAEPERAVVIAYSSDFEAEALERTGRFVRVRMPRRQFWAPSTVSFFYNQTAERMRR
jgi:predicted RNA methylase